MTMNEDDVTIIRNMKKAYRKRLSGVQTSLIKELEKWCEMLGGHYWYDWQEPRTAENLSVGGHVMHTHTRVCRACDKREYKGEGYRCHCGYCTNEK